MIKNFTKTQLVAGAIFGVVGSMIGATTGIMTALVLTTKKES